MSHDAPGLCSDVFREGEPITLIDAKQRIYVAVLEAGKAINIRGHRFAHDDLIGRPPGLAVRSSRGQWFHAVRPTLGQWVLKMPRFATVIYPKDLGPLLFHADIYPGARVLEAGIGSGALSLALLRVIGPHGELISYDVRDEALRRATKNVRMFQGEAPNHTIKKANVYEGVEEKGLDRIVLDVPEPWDAVPHAAAALRDDGIFASYSPTTTQMQQTVAALQDTRMFVDIDALETLERHWNVTRTSVRPTHRMIAHTGFLIFARKVGRGRGAPPDGQGTSGERAPPEDAEAAPIEDAPDA